MKHDAWSKAPRHAAAVWTSLGLYAELVALKLVVALDCHDGPVPGRIEDLVALVMRGTVRGRERENFRKAIRKARDAGLIFEHEGQVYILYSETQWRRHRALSEQAAQVARAVAAPTPEPPTPVAPEQVAQAPAAVVAAPPDNTNAVIPRTASPTKYVQPRLQLVAAPPTYRERTASVPLTCHLRTGQLELSTGNHSGQVLGERERERETDTACPVPATPAPLANLAKARTRRKTEADFVRDRVVEIFNEEYMPVHHIRAVPGKTDYGLLALTAQSYCPDGPLDEALVRKSVRAYLNDPSWRNFGGYNLRSWATHHARGLTRQAPKERFFVNV